MLRQALTDVELDPAGDHVLVSEQLKFPYPTPLHHLENDLLWKLAESESKGNFGFLSNARSLPVCCCQAGECEMQPDVGWLVPDQKSGCVKWNLKLIRQMDHSYGAVQAEPGFPQELEGLREAPVVRTPGCQHAGGDFWVCSALQGLSVLGSGSTHCISSK